MLANGFGKRSTKNAIKERYASGVQAIAGRGSVPNPGMSTATQVNLEPKQAESGCISSRVEIELKAGSMRRTGPLPRISIPISMGVACQLQDKVCCIAK